MNELLDSATRRQVCLVIAAAGWGKSTAVGLWAGGRPVAWLPPPVWSAPGTRPADGGLFAELLLTALRPYAGPPPAGLPDPRRAADDPFFGYASAVCGWLADALAEDLVLVADDVQDLPRGSGPARLLEGLCRHAPSRLHLLVVSRHEPPFSLARLFGRGLVSEIHAPDLAFGLAEVSALLGEAVRDCPAELARRVWQHTAGWPVAVHLAADLLRATAPGEWPAALERLVRPGERFHTYLTEEVLGAEPPDVRLLLYQLGVFGSVSPASEPVIGGPEVAVRLADLARRGLVRRMPGHEDRWCLVRPLSGFVDRTAVLPPVERARLHRAAAQACASRGAVAEALRHATAAGDGATCTNLLVEHGAALVSRGQVSAVLAAADLAVGHLEERADGPATDLATDADDSATRSDADPADDPAGNLAVGAAVQQVLGQARQVRGQWAMALACLRRASQDQAELEPAIALRVGMIAYAQGEFDQVLALPGRTRFGGDAVGEQARVLALVATARRMIGDYDGARADAERAMRLVHHGGDSFAVAACHATLALLAAGEGDLRRAEAHCASALETAELAGDLLQALWARLVRAGMLGESAQPGAAMADAEAAVELAETCEDAFLAAHALSTRATVRMRLGELDRALDDFAQARDMFQRIGSRFLAWPLCGMGDIYRVRGQLSRARAAYEEALALSEPSHEVLGLGTALAGLARVRAADDPEAAAELAERAVALGEGMRQVEALVARGWVAMQAGNRQQAAADGSRAAAAARARRDCRGLANALLLGVLSSASPAQHARSLSEAIQIWHESGCQIGEAVAALVAARVGAQVADLDPELAARTLHECGIDLRPPRPAGPLAVLARSAPSVSIRALGNFQVVRAGVTLAKGAWQSRKARQLLKILVARRRPVPRDQLMELLWPEADPSRSGNRLSVLLSTLRDVLQPGADQAEPGPLATDGSAVWLDHGHVEVDVERFLACATAALEAHRHDQPEAMTRLVAAEAAHSGGFLDDDPYQDWAVPLAEEVRATHVALLRALVSRLRQADEVDEFVRYTLRLLDNDRFDERAHVDLVEVLLGAGRYGEARRRYRIYNRAMTELGIEPRPFPATRRWGARLIG